MGEQKGQGDTGACEQDADNAADFCFAQAGELSLIHIFLALVITDIWKTAPYMALLILAGLQMVPDEMYEAAKIDGANVFQRFRFVTLPTVKTTVLVALLFRTLDAFRVFDLISVMTGGANGTESISVYAYNNLMKFLDFGYGSSLAVLIFIVVFIISLIYMKLMGDKLTEF